MAWRMARSLDVLLAEVNKFAPNRSKASDGGIGDEDHASRTSDHNPWVVKNGLGIVRARDFTHDPSNGLDAGKLALFLASKLGNHPAMMTGAYVIYNRRIISFDRIREGWRHYSGTNAHSKHVHVSVTTKDFDSVKAWGLNKASYRTFRIDHEHFQLTPTLDRRLIKEDVNQARTLEPSTAFFTNVTDDSYSMILNAFKGYEVERGTGYAKSIVAVWKFEEFVLMATAQYLGTKADPGIAKDLPVLRVRLRRRGTNEKVVLIGSQMVGSGWTGPKDHDDIRRKLWRKHMGLILRREMIAYSGNDVVITSIGANRPEHSWNNSKPFPTLTHKGAKTSLVLDTGASFGKSKYDYIVVSSKKWKMSYSASSHDANSNHDIVYANMKFTQES